jgi:hypothetical protein
VVHCAPLWISASLVDSPKNRYHDLVNSTFNAPVPELAG